MSNRKALGVIAGLVVLVGLILLFVPTAVAGGDVGCGSAMSPSSADAIGAELGDALSDIYAGGDGSDDGGYQALCDDRIGTQRVVAWSIVGVGALVLLFLFLTAQHKTRWDPPAAAPEGSEPLAPPAP